MVFLEVSPPPRKSLPPYTPPQPFQATRFPPPRHSFRGSNKIVVSGRNYTEIPLSSGGTCGYIYGYEYY